MVSCQMIKVNGSSRRESFKGHVKLLIEYISINDDLKSLDVRARLHQSDVVDTEIIIELMKQEEQKKPQ
jgi:hypothetical protein